MNLRATVLEEGGEGSKDDDDWVEMRRTVTDVTKKKTWPNKYKCNEFIYQICLSGTFLKGVT